MHLHVHAERIQTQLRSTQNHHHIITASPSHQAPRKHRVDSVKWSICLELSGYRGYAIVDVEGVEGVEDVQACLKLLQHARLFLTLEAGPDGHGGLLTDHLRHRLGPGLLSDELCSHRVLPEPWRPLLTDHQGHHRAPGAHRGTQGH